MTDCRICQQLGRKYCQYKKTNFLTVVKNRNPVHSDTIMKQPEQLQRTNATKIFQETFQLLQNTTYNAADNTQHYFNERLVYPIYPVYKLVYELKPKQAKSPLIVNSTLYNF